ncbi:MAG: BREX-2 system adenine-specific DNA-methyltransferase PglX [Myxococcales bacterium]|nr:BREX-2 system adenine-specific DNA-methyltransferase PglX [Myxococcales bacterium]
MARSRKVQAVDLPPQPDARAPLDRAAFLRAARPVLAALTADLLTRADADEGVLQALQRRHAAELAASRTAEDFPVWRRAVVVQVAAAWLLSCVFVRVLEDRGLVAPRIAGPGARDSEDAFFRIAPFLGPREYLLTVFRELTRLPAARPLFHANHNLVWALGPSAEACKTLLELFRTPHIDTPAFRFGQPDTRFLGDLYQELDDDVRDRFALLQTPDFVERFILDRTLEPALREYKVDHTDVIDPTCGSGHFLLGAFPRFMRELRLAHPGLMDRERAAMALGHIFGADINPYAVAIARFRLTLQFLETAEYTQLRGAPAPVLNVVVADSLYYGFAGGQGDLGERHEQTAEQAAAWYGKGFSLEDPEAARRVLVDRTYAAVVGNPPYITVKDPALRETYRDRYPESAAGKYALSAPFMQRFFQLAKQGGGYVGQITSNSFTKREFGASLIEKVLPKLDLELIVNTAGAFIPGHGTPTILVFGRNRAPVGEHVEAVLAKRGEPGVPPDPAEGQVWTSIVDHWNEEKFENDYISVEKLARATLKQHPWALEGGGAGALKTRLEEDTIRAKNGEEEQRKRAVLDNFADSIGISSFTLEDEVYIRPLAAWTRQQVSSAYLRSMLIGEAIRDWGVDDCETAIFPYSDTLDLAHLPGKAPEIVSLWTWHTSLSKNILFGGKTKIEGGLKWYEYGRLTTNKLRTPYSIAYAEVATHNHFILDRGGKVFKQTAPIIKLPADFTESDHLALLAYLNSSTTCFWMKQVSYPKGTHSETRPEKGNPEENRYAFSATALGGLPLPSISQAVAFQDLAEFATELERLQSRRDALTPRPLLRTALETREDLAAAAVRAEREDAALLARMVAVQEDLDWAVYAIFGLAPSDTVGRWTPDLELTPEQRPFKSPAPPHHLGPDDRRLWIARAAAIAESKQLRLIENQINKRRWWGARGVFAHKVATFAERVADAAAEQIADLAEQVFRASREQGIPTVLTAHALERELAGDPRYQALRDFLVNQNPRVDPLRDQLARESVPFLAGHRYSPSGRDRHNQWRAVWDYQRLADTLEAELPRFRAAFEAASAAAREAGTRLSAERSKLGAASFALSAPDPEAAPRRRGRKPATPEPAPTDDTPQSPELLAAYDAEAAARAAQNAARLDLEEAEAFHRKARAFIPVPQKYEPSDFRDPAYFRLRGKLDVPRERFIAYPGAASTNDPAPVYGWAGWTHLERALALLQLYYERKLQENWLPDRLIPLLAGLEELLPWVAQWHGDAVHPDTGERYVDAFETHITAGCTELGVTRAQLVDWTPPDARPARAPRPTTTADDADPPKRRPRSAEPAPDAPSDAPTTPKRRGRPPKAEAAPGDMSEAPPAPKRRGRPPKSASE